MAAGQRRWTHDYPLYSGFDPSAERLALRVLHRLSTACTMQGQELKDAVDRGLRAVNLHHVADKQAGQYSGGMKRRLSVAIAFMGNPAMVYLDEPSTVC